MKHWLVYGAIGMLAACSDGKSKFDSKTYQEQKATLGSKEKDSPLGFLEVQSKDHRNIFGQTVVKGTVHNTATLCSYKDIRVKLLYYKQQKLVANHEEVYKETLAPGDDFIFKARYKTPKGTDSVAVSLMSAVPVTAASK